MTENDAELRSRLKSMFKHKSVYKPEKLVRKLEKKGYSSRSIRSAVWHLVDTNYLVLNEQRNFQGVTGPRGNVVADYSGREKD
jgi:hypothetical protein